MAPNPKMAIVKGAFAGALVWIIYIAVVVVTTPSLPVTVAISTALAINPIIIYGAAIGTGFQIFSASYGKALGCRIHNKRKIIGVGTGGTAVSSFLSFFSLVPLGCCGSWLFILSLLPSVFGSSISIVLIRYSTPFSYFGLAVVIGFAILSAIRLYKETKRRKKVQLMNRDYNRE